MNYANRVVKANTNILGMKNTPTLNDGYQEITDKISDDIGKVVKTNQTKN